MISSFLIILSALQRISEIWIRVDFLFGAYLRFDICLLALIWFLDLGS
jgi:hypothetical protein